MSERTTAIVLLALLALVPPLAAALDQPFYLDLFGRMMVYALAAVSLNFILGYGGMVSFGHAAFLGIGGYAIGILSSNGIHDALIQWPVALAASSGFAFLTGLVVLRTSGVYFIMITLAFAQMLFFFFNSLEIYGGDDGLTLAKRSMLAGMAVFENATALYYTIFAILVLALAASARIVGSRFGMAIRAAKSNERRLRALGVSTFRYRLAAYTLSGTVCGLAGVLLANETEFVAPSVIHWARSGELIVMVILGGMGTVFGPLFGAIAYLTLSHYLADLTRHWHVILGPLLILVVLFARGGIAGFLAGRGGRGRAGP
jgi:branched-chain amino acid transport system permease protein